MRVVACVEFTLTSPELIGELLEFYNRLGFQKQLCEVRLLADIGGLCGIFEALFFLTNLAPLLYSR